MAEEVVKVWLENETGPREVLPESLWPGLTRESITVRGWQGSLRRAQGSFNQNQNGVWLPPLEDSELDLRSLGEELDRPSADLLLEEDVRMRLAECIGRVGLTDLGCWETEDTSVLAELASTDTVQKTKVVKDKNAIVKIVRNKVLEEGDQLDTVRQCGNQNCVYHRHYDLTFGVPSDRRSLLYPNLKHFQTDPQGQVITSWGDALPTVDDSRKHLRTFQERCVPFVPRDKSLLTALHISQISLLPDTGCWFSNNYYMTPVGADDPDWQYDGYSRIRVPSAMAKSYKYKDFAVLGHRVTWLMNNGWLPDPDKLVLNHRCGFRPCVNPGHLEPITQDQNMLHAQMMLTASRMLRGALPTFTGVIQLELYAGRLGMDPKPIQEFWQKEIAA